MRLNKIDEFIIEIENLCALNTGNNGTSILLM